MHAHVGDIAGAPRDMRLQRGEGIKRVAGKRVVLHIADAAFVIAFRLRATRRACDGANAPVLRKRKQARMETGASHACRASRTPARAKGASRANRPASHSSRAAQLAGDAFATPAKRLELQHSGDVTRRTQCQPLGGQRTGKGWGNWVMRGPPADNSG